MGTTAFIELDFDSEDFGPDLKDCLVSGTPVSFLIRGRAAVNLRGFVKGETIDDWPRLAGVPLLNILCAAITLALSQSMRYA